MCDTIKIYAFLLQLSPLCPHPETFSRCCDAVLCCYGTGRSIYHGYVSYYVATVNSRGQLKQSFTYLTLHYSKHICDQPKSFGTRQTFNSLKTESQRGAGVLFRLPPLLNYNVLEGNCGIFTQNAKNLWFTETLKCINVNCYASYLIQ